MEIPGVPAMAQMRSITGSSFETRSVIAALASALQDISSSLSGETDRILHSCERSIRLPSWSVEEQME